MKLCNCLFICFSVLGEALLFGGVVLSGQPTVNLSLEDAFARAPEANFDILIGTERLESQRQTERRSRSNLLPQVTAEASQSRARSYGSSISTPDHTSLGSRFDALLRARMSLFDVQNHADYRVAKFNTEIAQLNLDATVEDILLAIGQTYFAHLRNLRRIEVIEADIARDETFLELARSRYEAGAATEIDVTRAEVSLSTNQLRLVEQETQLDESSLSLKQALNINLAAALKVDPVNLPTVQPVAFSAVDFDAVLAGRPEVVGARRTLERNRLAKKAADWQQLPSIDLTGTYGRSGTTFDEDTSEVWSVGLGISVPLFEGFRIDADKLDAASAVRAQQTVLAQLENSVEADYRLQLSRLSARVRQVEIAQQQVNLASRELELARVRFEEGVADNSEVVDAQARLAEANDGLVEAEYQFYLTRLQIARIRGDVRSVLNARS